jgi:hypothetical protein
MPKKRTIKKGGLLNKKRGKKRTNKRIGQIQKRIPTKIVYVQGPQPQKETVVGAAGQGLGWGFGFGAGEAVAENLFDRDRGSYNYGSAINYGSY